MVTEEDVKEDIKKNLIETIQKYVGPMRAVSYMVDQKDFKDAAKAWISYPRNSIKIVKG